METTTRYHLMPHTYQNEYYKKRQAVTSVGEDVEKRKHRDTAGMNANWFSHYGKNVEFL